MVDEYTYDLNDELDHIRIHQVHRKIPQKSPDKVLVATWNIRQLTGGSSIRDQKDYRLIAEIIKPFDIVAIQEVKDNLGGLRSVMQYLPANYKVIFTDRAGNTERLAYIYDTNIVKPTELAGELVLLDYEREKIALPNIQQEFVGFNRNPFQVSFQAGEFGFVLVNVHTYYGSATVGSEGYNRRLLETFALAKWAGTRVKSRNVYDSDIILLGDFNLPKMKESDPIYQQLEEFGLRLPKYPTEMGTSLDGLKDYDQIAFFPDNTDEEFQELSGVFDFDDALFPDLWNNVPEGEFKDFVKNHISDHRVLWAAFGTGIETQPVIGPPSTEPPTKITTILDMELFSTKEKMSLTSADIQTTADLLKRVLTPELREQLRKETGLKSQRINDLANYMDLMRITTVSEGFAVLLESVGVDSVPELAIRNPDNLFNNSITPYNITGKSIITVKPTIDDVRKWVIEAKTLPKMVEY
ncbi:MAG: DUF4332 domain-containing protein [Thermoplasmata archaeon]|nr:MAG: DUF4332 domain-containing protein [Thermoplasmata archaeon]